MVQPGNGRNRFSESYSCRGTFPDVYSAVQRRRGPIPRRYGRTQMMPLRESIVCEFHEISESPNAMHCPRKNRLLTPLSRILVLSLFPCLVASAAERYWPSYLGDVARSHYSQLKQIDARNVAQLE